MSSTLSRDKEFIDRLTKITEDNLSNEQFGVNELASKIGMSRSNLHRKVKSAAGVSISKFICQIRLKRATELLQGTSSTISEVAFECGFHSVSYFTKCFHDHYGYPPGKARSDGFEGSDPNDLQKDSSKYRIVRNQKYLIAAIAGGVVITSAVILVILLKPFGSGDQPLDKSIAVLPFRNDSPDEEKMYFINGTMDAILDNLCKIEGLRVVSRNSVEQYRDHPKSTPEIAREMKVSYILAGSGLKDGDNIRLAIQLIDGKNDKLLWSRTFERNTEEQFDLLSEIPQLVAGKINVVITPEEKDRIEKKPTISFMAYDFYQRGIDKMFDWWNLDDTIARKEAEYSFNKALEYDSSFAAAYARLASVINFNEVTPEQRFDSAINIADRALSMDNQCAEAYSTKGYHLMMKGQYDLALETLKKGIEYNPNFWELYGNLGSTYLAMDKPGMAIANSYQAYLLHRGKFLPVLISQIVGFLSHMGFKDQAQAYCQELLELNGDSLAYFSGMKDAAYNNGDLTEAIRYSEKEYTLDSNNIWTIYNLAFYYTLVGQYKEALSLFGKKGFQNLYGVFHRIGYAYWQLGEKEKAEIYFKKMIDIQNEVIESGYAFSALAFNYYNLAGIYAFKGEKEKAFEYLRLFNQDDPNNYWELGRDLVTLIHNDPLFNGIRDEPEFQQVVRDVEARFQVRHEKIKKWLDENDML